jgi:hypothetical protein
VILTGEEPEGILAALPLEAGAPFSLRFINSIYLAPVEETYAYDPAEGITTVKVESPSAGVFEYYGLEPDGTGVAVVRHRASEIRIRSADYTNHVLTVAGKRLRLLGLVPGGAPMTLRVGACP